VFFGSGFALWNVDNVYCGSITNVKRSIGLPWAFVIELHGWWHILTGIGAYICILVFYSALSELKLMNI
jgi:dihydroceramidase